MAIAKINKIEIIGLQEDKDRLLSLLQRMGTVELISLQDPGISLSPPMVCESDILAIEEAIAYLANFKEKAGLFSGMLSFKPVVYEEQLKEIIANFDYQGLLKRLSDLRNHLKNLTQQREKLIQERQLLLPWRKLGIPVAEIGLTKNCGIILGMLYRRDHLKLLEDFKKENISLFSEVVNQDRVNNYITVIYMQDDFERLQAVLKNYHFNFVTFGHHKGTVSASLLEINREILVLDDHAQVVKGEIKGLLKDQFKLMALYDYFGNIRRMQEADKNLAKQQLTFCLTGWIRHKVALRLEQAIARSIKDVAMFISEPGAEEEVPVELENNRIIQPFEFITKIYGYPKYSELDPTPYLAPFFFLYFGLCISDVGYGLILTVFSFLALKKLRLGPQGLRFFRLFLYCGISTIIIGALTGSWFGNLPDLLAQHNKAFIPFKKFKDALVILDPMKEPTKLLGIALSLGIVQVWFGNIVAAIGNIKNKRYLDVLYDQVTMLVFLFGLTGLGLIFLKLTDASSANIFKYSALLGSVALILTQGRSEKGLGAKIFYGFYNLYNSLSGYLSDILSYSRLWALGLVTGVMAATINLISAQFSQIVVTTVPFIGKIVFIKAIVSGLVLAIIFVVGHLVSFLMNLLGAFVHPVRLQFVEFFSKFFKTSGRALRPFKVETKYTSIN